MMKTLKVVTLAMLLTTPFVACDKFGNDDQLTMLTTENDRLVKENEDLKIKVARLEERVKLAQAKPANPAVAAAPASKPGQKPKPKQPSEASPAEKEQLTQAVTGGGSFK